MKQQINIAVSKKVSLQNQLNPTAGSIRHTYFRNFENGYYGNRNYELAYIYNTI